VRKTIFMALLDTVLVDGIVEWPPAIAETAGAAAISK